MLIQDPIRRAALSGLLTVMPAAVAPAARVAVHRHHAGAVSHVVQLSAQPNTPLEDAARTLAAHDIADSNAHGSQPLVLVGSASLASRAHAPAALFVQLQSASLCGSAGCETSVYLPRAGGGWDKVLDSVSGPIAVLAASHARMHDLLVGGHDRWVWNGTAYADTMQAPTLIGLRRSVERHQKAVAKDGGQVPPPP